ncbi:MAG: S8 family serine peptidase [Ignavibacteriae bacterium]|nr:S8 family serine peptidase [Ignavibacteria bacterium]MBI3364370.1 S8 family serine peptidase [Ignavibacteriota bacterium]
MKDFDRCLRAIVWSIIVYLLLNAQTGQAQLTIKRGIWNGQDIEYADRMISIKVKPGVVKEQLSSALQILGAKFNEDIDVLRWTTIELPESLAVFDALHVLETNGLIEKAIPTAIRRTAVLPNDPYFRGTTPATYPYQWALKNTGQSPPGGTPGADIKAEQAWDITTGNPNVVLAILDTGIPLQSANQGGTLLPSLSHPDFSDPNRIILGHDFVDVYPADTTVRDENAHGTHVAGIAAAQTNNGEGVAGVAWNCRLLIIQVFDYQGNGTASQYRNGVRYAVDYQRNNPQVRVLINYSGGGWVRTPEDSDAAAYANTYNVPIFAAAGNFSTDSLLSPAALSSSYTNMIAVGATDQDDLRAAYSNYGRGLTLVAPGGRSYLLTKEDEIFSTTPNYLTYLEQRGFTTRTYSYLVGTSMATPFVTGTAALMLSVNSSLTASQIRDMLSQSADDKGTVGYDSLYGWGRLNAYKAVKQAIAKPSRLAPPDCATI